MPEHLSLAEPLLVDSREAHRLLSVSERTLWGITAPRGDLPCVRIGRAVRYSVADLQQYIERLRTQALEGVER